MKIYNVRDQRNKIDNLKERIERLRAVMEMGSRRVQLAPGRTAVRDKLADDMAKLDELERQLVGEVAALELEIRCVEHLLDGLPAQQQRIMRLRYVEGLSWRRVARRAGYSVDHCYRIHRAAIKRCQ